MFRIWATSDVHPDGMMYYPGKSPGLLLNLYGDVLKSDHSQDLEYEIVPMRIGYNDIHLMRSTQRMDDRLQMMYEGDIIKWDAYGTITKTGVIVYGPDHAAFMIEGFQDWLVFLPKIDKDCQWEVIGNIYEGIKK
jgi:hypothetical protein